jgi:HTH-type transcriptional regulator, sugar sensing transcriptional regulator
MENIKEILSGIDIPEPAQKIYTALLEEGEASARTLSHRTGVTRTSIYDQIKILRTKGLITERFIEGTTVFSVCDVRQLSILLNERIEKLSLQQKSLDENLTSLLKRSRSIQPKVRFFEGEEGAKQLLKDILWYDDITLYIYWPYQYMLNFIGKDFLLWFNERRRVRNITIKTIWGVSKSGKNDDIFNDGKDVERRYMTPKSAPSMSYIIYDKKVAFISSHKESFGFIVESTEFKDLIKMQFDVLWANARK